MVGIIGDRAGKLGENGEYWMGRLRVVWIINSKLWGDSLHLCWLRPTSVGSKWTSIWNVLMHTGHMESPNWVALCVTETEAILPYLTGVQWNSACATHGVSTEAYAWKMCTRVRWALTVSLAVLWNVATHGALQAYVSYVFRFIPLQGWLLIWISATPSDMGDCLFAESKRRSINFIIMWW
jgi:hypothetical protein